LEFLSLNKEVFIEWSANIVTITKDGIVSLGSKKYYFEHIERRRNKVIYLSKLIAIIATVLSIIIGIITITEHFTNLPK